MSQIDSYLQSMERFKASGIILASDSNIVLKFPTGDRSATQTTTHDQVREMIREIAPAGSMTAIDRGAVSSFFYRGAKSSFEVAVAPKGAKWVVTISPSQEEAPPVGLGSSPGVAQPAEFGMGDSAGATRLSGHDMSGIASIANRSSAPSGDTQAASSPGLGTPQFTPAPAATPAALATPAPVAIPDPVAPEATPEEPAPTTPAPEPRAIPASLAMKVAEPAIDRSANDWIDQILRKMMRSGSSDVHLSSGSTPYWRVDGNIEKIPNEAEMAPDFLEEQIRRIAPEENWEEFGRRNDTDFAYEVKGLSRFRVNVFRDRKGVGTVMRTIPFDIPSAEALGLPKAILDMANLSKGLVLVTGPTGSGKSTTLAALIDYINETRRDHLITIEDPIEFVHPNKQCLVNQREIRRHTNSFKDALRAALREDPDIVMVGEMRDLETIEIAVETAETGHLVFGTLHTTTAPSTVDRIIDQFPTDRQEQIRQMLATSLKGVISQVLCRKKGGGRVAAHEILVGTPAVSNLIRESKTFQLFSLMQTGRNLGMLKMEDSLLKLVQDDLVEPLEAYRKANNKQEFATMLQRAGYSIEAE